ncbi:MAG: LD-carboxypeptidase [Flavobacteriales bacterium]
MTSPQYLEKGDKVRIISTARKVSESEVEPAIKQLKEWGLQVELGENLFKSYHQFAGTEKERIDDLQDALNEDKIKGVLCARGGYGTAQLIPHTDFTKFYNKPKWIVGYSDITVLHSYINQILDIETIHGSMPVNFEHNTKEALNSLKKALFGEKNEYSITPHAFNQPGYVQSQITGGNLSILHNLTGTYLSVNTNDKILFIEELDEYLYHIDRMMMNLELSGILKNLKAVVVGGMTDMNDNKVPYGQTAEEIITHRLSKYNYPVCFNAPIGHFKDNRAVICGRETSLEINERRTFIEQRQENKE